MTRNSDRQRTRRRSDFSVVSQSRIHGLDVIQEQMEDIEETLVSITDKRLQIYDSHAVDYSRYARTKKESKAKNSSEKKSKKVKKKPLKSTENIKDVEEEPTEVGTKFDDDETISSDDTRRCSIHGRLSIDIDPSVSIMFTREPATHDTLKSFLTHYREQKHKDRRIKNIQSRAKVKTPIKTQNKLTPVNHSNLVLPPIARQAFGNTGNPIAQQNGSRKKGKSQLPKVFGNDKVTKRNHSNDARFEKLVSTLQPVYNGSKTAFPKIITRNGRSYTV